jgi:hypothetical protein
MSESSQAKGKLYDIGGEMLSVADIAERAGVSVRAVRDRLNKGLTGIALIEPQHQGGADSGWKLFMEKWAEAKEQGLSAEQMAWKKNGYRNGDAWILPNGRWPDYLRVPGYAR